MIFTDNNKYPILPKMDPFLLETLNQYLKEHPDEIFHIPYICGWLASLRIDQVKPEDFRFFEGKDGSPIIENAIEHNYKGLIGKVSLMRPLILAMALRSISWVTNRIKNLRVLTVGPRTEAEIFMLAACGFDPSNIRGLDLISYSGFIDVGDMHNMPYEDNSFDVVILGWVLAYSDDPALAAKEVIRVAAPDAIVAVGCEYTPYTEEELKEQGSLVAHGGKYNSVDDILNLFGEDVARVYFQDDVHPDEREQRGSVKTIFQLK